MQINHITNFKGGWFIGDFEPSILRTKGFEVAYHKYKAGQDWDKHHHKIATEYNLLISGEMRINDGPALTAGYVFVIKAGESTKPTYITDCEIIIIKVPSVIGDKYIDE